LVEFGLPVVRRKAFKRGCSRSGVPRCAIQPSGAQTRARSL
jgi:hypothetical protein